MEKKAQAGLQHVPTGGGLSLHAGRAGIVSRGRRDAANSAANPDYRQAVEDFNAGRFAAAAAGFERAAGQGHADAQYLLSTMYDAGQGVAPDAGAAALWEGRAAEQGHTYAQANASFRCYSAGDLAGALGWCRRAAEARLAWAQYNLGLMYRKGEGVERDDAEAAYWYRLAAAQGYVDAQVKLGGMFYFGLGVRRDYREAAVWFRKAAEQGDAEAQFQLGCLYETGLGVEQDYTEYRRWMREAAKQGHAEAVGEVRRREYRDA
jgi:hypothetical protein